MSDYEEDDNEEGKKGKKENKVDKKIRKQEEEITQLKGCLRDKDKRIKRIEERYETIIAILTVIVICAGIFSTGYAYYYAVNQISNDMAPQIITKHYIPPKPCESNGFGCSEQDYHVFNFNMYFVLFCVIVGIVIIYLWAKLLIVLDNYFSKEEE